MVTVSDMQRVIEDRLQHSIEGAIEFHRQTLRPQDEGFAEGLEAALDIVEGVFYEWSEIHSQQEEHY